MKKNNQNFDNLNQNERSNFRSSNAKPAVGQDSDRNTHVHQWDETPYIDFEEIKKNFIHADLDEKIRIYTTTGGLSVEQFKELLREFPLQHLDKLERAMEQ